MIERSVFSRHQINVASTVLEILEGNQSVNHGAYNVGVTSSFLNIVPVLQTPELTQNDLGVNPGKLSGVFGNGLEACECMAAIVFARENDPTIPRFVSRENPMRSAGLTIVSAFVDDKYPTARRRLKDRVVHDITTPDGSGEDSTLERAQAMNEIIDAYWSRMAGAVDAVRLSPQLGLEPDQQQSLIIAQLATGMAGAIRVAPIASDERLDMTRVAAEMIASQLTRHQSNY